MQLHAAFGLALVRGQAFRFVWKVHLHPASGLALVKWPAFRPAGDMCAHSHTIMSKLARSTQPRTTSLQRKAKRRNLSAS